MLIFEGKEIETDTEGYLKESSQWSEPLAVVIAFGAIPAPNPSDVAARLQYLRKLRRVTP